MNACFCEELTVYIAGSGNPSCRLIDMACIVDMIRPTLKASCFSQ